MIKLQLTNELGGILVENVSLEGEQLTNNVYDTLLVYAKGIFKQHDANKRTLTVKKGVEIKLNDLIREDLFIDIEHDDKTFTLNIKFNDFIKATNYQGKFVKYVVKHNKMFGEVEIETDIDVNWESFLDTLFCRRDEEGNRPCEYCNEKCTEEWVTKAYEHYIDMQTFALPVLAD